jgi:AcrR family transcriptional regulator
LIPRDRILVAAEDVFAANGFRGGSLNDVAKLAGYTRAGLLHYYPSKAALLLAVLDHRDEELDAQDAKLFQGSIVATLESGQNLLGTVLEDRTLVQLAHVLTAEASDPAHPAHDWVSRRQDRVRSGLAKAIRRSVELGELPASTDVATLASVVLGVVEGLEAQWLIDPSIDPARGLRAFAQLLQK